MTLPFERTSAVLQMREWLLRMAYEPGRINKRLFKRELASRLKHYPSACDFRNPAQSFEKVKP